MLRSKRISFILLFVVISFLYVGCSSSSTGNYKSEMATDSVNEISAMPEESFNKGENIDFNAPESREQVAEDSATQNTSNSDFDYGNRKMIKTGNITIETLNYKQAHESIINLIKEHNGYIEQMQENSSGYFEKKLKRTNITIRVPKENFNILMTETGDLGYISNKNSSVRDVSDVYFDTEARLKSLEVQEERLLEILKKTEDLSHIIQLENKLANTRYQIENLTGTLNKYDKLVAYSTLNVNLIEVEEEKKDVPTKKETLLTRIKYNLSDSYKEAKEFIENLILFIARNIVQGFLYLIILIIVILMIRKIDKKTLLKKEKKDNIKDKNIDNQDENKDIK